MLAALPLWMAKLIRWPRGVSGRLAPVSLPDARGAPCRLTDEALATDKWRYNHFELARLNKWHRPVSGSSDAGAISLALR
ncbi:jg11171 [Pararge aegeria aegeria]|uniref:Jg11171 protein n=1 Tax=Pararge aegeria aegeria TaxID=348720 RepID=A0A8S4RK22_9NEOP|nr:jg11171 [Pararge aegeria aegeria]